MLEWIHVKDVPVPIEEYVLVALWVGKKNGCKTLKKYFGSFSDQYELYDDDGLSEWGWDYEDIEYWIPIDIPEFPD